MAYADQQMSGNRITVLVIVALIHIFLGYALITGLAYSAVQQVIKKVTTVDIKKDEPKKPPPPPPPPKNLPPPPVAPPVKINIAPTPPQIQTVTTPPPPTPVFVLPPPSAPPAPPPPRFAAKGASPKGSPQDWATPDDYPARALREERAGTVGFRVTVGPDGRPSDCEVTSSSGSPDLDEITCTLMKRRGRFTPATDGDGKATGGSYSSRIKWVVPKD